MPDVTWRLLVVTELKKKKKSAHPFRDARISLLLDLIIAVEKLVAHGLVRLYLLGVEATVLSDLEFVCLREEGSTCDPFYRRCIYIIDDVNNVLVSFT